MRINNGYVACSVFAAIAAGGCMIGDDAIGDDSELQLGTTDQAIDVTWQNVVGVTATGNDLTKTSALASWKAGASSVESIGGDGYAEFTTAESNTAKMAGLSTGDTTRAYTEIDFAIYMAANGRVYVYENGVNRGNLGPYVAGDVFRIESIGGIVTYRQNGNLLFTSAGSPTFPLLLDTSFYTPNGTINDAKLISNLVSWKNAVGVSAIANNLVKTDAATTWKAGASSNETLTGDGQLEFTTAEANTAKMAGLSVGDANQGYLEIDFAIYLAANGKVYVYESGVNRGMVGTYLAADVFTVTSTGGVITYEKNGALLFTSAGSPGSPLGVDTSLRTPGATMSAVRLVTP